MGGKLEPFVLCGGILAYHPQLAVQNANAPGYRDHLAGGGIVPGCKKRGFAAGHLQAAALHILHPCRGLALASRELHRRFHRLPALGQLHRELPALSSAPSPRNQSASSALFILLQTHAGENTSPFLRVRCCWVSVCFIIRGSTTS